MFQISEIPNIFPHPLKTRLPTVQAGVGNEEKLSVVRELMVSYPLLRALPLNSPQPHGAPPPPHNSAHFSPMQATLFSSN